MAYRCVTLSVKMMTIVKVKSTWLLLNRLMGRRDEGEPCLYAQRLNTKLVSAVLYLSVYRTNHEPHIVLDAIPGISKITSQRCHSPSLYP